MLLRVFRKLSAIRVRDRSWFTPDPKRECRRLVETQHTHVDRLCRMPGQLQPATEAALSCDGMPHGVTAAINAIGCIRFAEILEIEMSHQRDTRFRRGGFGARKCDVWRTGRQRHRSQAPEGSRVHASLRVTSAMTSSVRVMSASVCANETLACLLGTGNW